MGQRLTNTQIRKQLEALQDGKSTIITLRGRSGFGHEKAWAVCSHKENKYYATITADGEAEEYQGTIDGLMALIARYRRRPRRKKAAVGHNKKP